jgi:anti-sigma factor RsiW
MNDVHSFGGGIAPHLNKPHLNKSDVELYVINALALDRAAEIESHVACCEDCACALAREAQLEMALEIVAERAAAAAPASNVVPMAAARSTRRPQPHRANAAARLGNVARAARVTAGFAGALAAAATLVMWIARDGSSVRTDAGDNVATYGAVSADAAGAMVSFDHDVKPAADTLDGG